MPIKIKLIDGESLLVDVDVKEWNRAFQKALGRGSMLEIEDADGRVLSINPHQILYLEEAPAEGSGADFQVREPA